MFCKAIMGNTPTTLLVHISAFVCGIKYETIAFGEKTHGKTFTNETFAG